MTRTIYTYERHNLGDQLIFLHLLRALAKPRPSTTFVHFCNGCHIGQLMEVVADIPNIFLLPFENPLWQEKASAALCVWKNHDDAWVNSPLRWDWSAYTLWHHGEIAQKMGLESPLTCREHLLFDWMDGDLWSDRVQNTFFVCNSEPNSGQFSPMRQHDSGYLDELIIALYRAGHSVFCTKYLKTQYGSGERGGSIMVYDGIGRLTPTQIARLSVCCTHHIMIATGPMWPTLNTTNHHHHAGRKRIVLLDNGEVLGLPHITQVATVEEVMEIARKEGWL